MSILLENVRDFRTGFESVIPVTKIAKITALAVFGITKGLITNALFPKPLDNFGTTVTIDRSAYNEVMNRREYYEPV